MKDDLISILIPARNAEDYLRECLASIIDQTFQQWELIVVNDHSDDQTNLILDEFSKRDERITWLDNTGKGIIPALRLALSQSKGNFITRMDADDIMPPHKLELLYEACRGGPENTLASGKVEYFSEYKLGRGFLKYQRWLNKLIEEERPFSEIYRECSIASPNWMMRRTFLEKIGAFNSDIYPEDYDLLFRAYQRKAELRLIKKVTHLWRDHQSRASKTDPNYKDNSFLKLKVNFFLKIDYNPAKELKLHGAGWRAKRIAKLLLQSKIPFTWCTNNPNKIGQDIYGVILQDQDVLLSKNSKRSQIIVAISAPADQEQITGEFQRADLGQGVDYFYFC